MVRKSDHLGVHADKEWLSRSKSPLSLGRSWSQDVTWEVVYGVNEDAGGHSVAMGGLALSRFAFGDRLAQSFLRVFIGTQADEEGPPAREQAGPQQGEENHLQRDTQLDEHVRRREDGKRTRYGDEPVGFSHAHMQHVVSLTPVPEPRTRCHYIGLLVCTRTGCTVPVSRS